MKCDLLIYTYIISFYPQPHRHQILQNDVYQYRKLGTQRKAYKILYFSYLHDRAYKQLRCLFDLSMTLFSSSCHPLSLGLFICFPLNSTYLHTFITSLCCVICSLGFRYSFAMSYFNPVMFMFVPLSFSHIWLHLIVVLSLFIFPL